MDGPYKLKWLNGPLVGRELALPVGDLDIGGSKSDIALCLEMEAQATLSMTEEVIRLVSVTPVWVDGQPWGLEQALPLGRVIDLAGQAFVLGLAADELSMQAVPARATEGITTARSMWPWWAGSVSGAMVVLVVGLMVWLPIAILPSLDLDDWLATQLQDPHLSGLSAQRDKSGSLVLKGVCHSSLSVEGLRLKLREVGVLLRDESVCADTLLESVRAVLSLNGYKDVEVKSEEPLNRVVIFGNIVADATWQRASAQLRMIRALESWRVVNDQALLFDDLLNRLESRQALEGLSIRVSNSTFWVSGHVGREGLVAVTEVLDAFNLQGPPRLPAVFQSIPGMASADQYLPSPIVGIAGNVDSPYVELANGMRLQPGSVLPSGYQVYELNRWSMALLKGQDLISLPLDL